MKIIITGSLGNISKPLSVQLLQKGNDVTVISSNADKQKEIESLGATAAIGKLDDADFLSKTFDGADAVYLMIPPNFAAPDSQEYYKRIGNNYKTAVLNSNVKRVVHLSSIGAHLGAGTGFILGSHFVENILNDLYDVSVTHLRPGYFYYNLNNFADMIKAAGFIGTNYGADDKLVMADPRDIADAAAEELQKATGENVRYVASADMSGNEVAKIIGEAIQKPDLTWKLFTDEQAKKGMEDAGMPPHVVKNFIEMGSSIHSGALREDYDARKAIVTGKVSIKDFAKEFAEGYNK